VELSVYKKGAEAVRDRLQAQEASIAQLTQALHSQGEGSPATPGAVARLEKSGDREKRPALSHEFLPNAVREQTGRKDFDAGRVDARTRVAIRDESKPLDRELMRR